MASYVPQLSISFSVLVPNLSWLTKIPLHWILAVVIDSLRIILQFYLTSKRVMQLVAGEDDVQELYDPDSRKDVKAKFKSSGMWILLTCIPNCLLMVYRWIENLTRADWWAKWSVFCQKWTCRILIALIVCAVCILLWFGLYLLATTLINIQMMEQLGVIKLLGSPARVAVSSANLNSVAHATNLNYMSAPAYVLSAKSRVLQMEAALKSYNLGQTSKVASFNAEWCGYQVMYYAVSCSCPKRGSLIQLLSFHAVPAGHARTSPLPGPHHAVVCEVRVYAMRATTNAGPHVHWIRS